MANPLGSSPQVDEPFATNRALTHLHVSVDAHQSNRSMANQTCACGDLRVLLLFARSQWIWQTSASR